MVRQEMGACRRQVHLCCSLHESLLDLIPCSLKVPFSSQDPSPCGTCEIHSGVSEDSGLQPEPIAATGDSAWKGIAGPKKDQGEENTRDSQVSTTANK